MKIKEFFKNLWGFFDKNSATKPISIHTPSDGEIARNNGMQQSIDSANSVIKNWSDIAYVFLLDYADSHDVFMIEDLRIASVGLVPEPPSNRAWGGIAIRAAKNGIIRRRGFQSVKNVKAHATPATLWEVV